LRCSSASGATGFHLLLIKLVFTILAAVAEAKCEQIREGTSDVKSDQAKRGRYVGGAVPFGWRADDEGMLVPMPDEQRARAGSRPDAARAGAVSGSLANSPRMG
jgi:DNA invertase Pin-like site-specific DNA recombinase